VCGAYKEYCATRNDKKSDVRLGKKATKESEKVDEKRWWGRAVRKTCAKDFEELLFSFFLFFVFFFFVFFSRGERKL
jgi:hypothetical protein